MNTKDYWRLVFKSVKVIYDNNRYIVVFLMHGKPMRSPRGNFVKVTEKIYLTRMEARKALMRYLRTLTPIVLN